MLLLVAMHGRRASVAFGRPSLRNTVAMLNAGVPPVIPYKVQSVPSRLPRSPISPVVIGEATPNSRGTILPGMRERSKQNGRTPSHGSERGTVLS